MTEHIFSVAFAASIAPQMAYGALITIELTLSSFIVALVVGLPLALGKLSHVRPLSYACSFVVEFIRSTPILIQLFLMYFGSARLGFPIDPVAAGIAILGVHYGCYMCETYRAGILAVPAGQWESAHAISLTKSATYIFVILPQAIKPMIPLFGNDLIAMFKDASLLAAISVFELVMTAKLIGSESFRYTEPFTIAGLFFLMMSVFTALMFRGLERYVEQKDKI